MRSKLAASTSIYWDSVDSSIGSSGSAGSRNYVDPWDLENYAYIRRHSIAANVPDAPQPIYQTARSAKNRQHSPYESDYWLVSFSLNVFNFVSIRIIYVQKMLDFTKVGKMCYPT